MSNTKAEKEELKKLEDEAYFELCQIIAEAMQLQDIELLDYRISSWKNRYKKLLDGLASPEFKKKIEYLLNEYYSSVTQYIYSQIKFKENKKIENQSKALVKLYRIIKETNDLNTLKSKVKEWEKQYPKSSFLKMYQKKIDSYTSTRNLEENAFNQEEAFSDLVDITKRTSTFEEFSKSREEWEKKYSIHNKFELDDFIKHKSEIKRYTSDEYLHSISRKDEVSKENNDSTSAEITELPKTPMQSPLNKKCSDIDKQAAAYASILAISKKPNNVNEMFKWVYKNSSIKFDDKYKELILSATYLDYSPTYLNKLKVPDLDVGNKSLSYKEFNEMDDIKKYAIISYFNLLLPPDKAISNNFFNSCINTLYVKSEEAKHASSSLNEISQENLRNGIEIKLSKSDAEQEFDLPELKKQNIPDTNIKEIPSSIIEEKQKEDNSPEEKLQEDLSAEPKIASCNTLITSEPFDNIKVETKKIVDDETTSKVPPTELPIAGNEITIEKSATLKKIDKENAVEKEDTVEKESIIQEKELKKEVVEAPTDNKETLTILPKIPTSNLNPKGKSSEEELSTLPEKPVEKNSILDTSPNNSFKKSVAKDEEKSNFSENFDSEPLQQEQIVAISPLFFSAINYKAKQAEVVNKIDEHVDDYVLSSSRAISDNVQTKQKTDWD